MGVLPSSACLVVPWWFLVRSRCGSLRGLRTEIDEVEKVIVVRSFLLGLAVSLPFK